MKNITLNEQVVNAIRSHYTETSTEGGPLNWLLSEEAMEQPLFDVIVDHMKNVVKTTSTFDVNKTVLNGSAKLLAGTYPEHSKAISEAVVFSEQYYAEKDRPLKRESTLRKEGKKAYLDTLTGTQQLLTSLAVETGVLWIYRVTIWRGICII